MINILFFSKYRECVGFSSLELDASGLLAVSDLLTHLKQTYPDRTSFLFDQNLLISVNQEVANQYTKLKNGDEVAIFPPVTGG